MEQGYADQLVPIGMILKSVGYHGALLIDTYSEFDSTWDNIEKCLIRLDGVWAPFFIISKDVKQDGLLVLFEDLQDNKLAKSLSQEEIFILKKDIIPNVVKEEGEDLLDEWLGFTIYDIHTDFSGLIEEVEELPSQLIAYVGYQGKRIAIPLAEELIIDLNPDQKSIKMDLPEGLIDL